MNLYEITLSNYDTYYITAHDPTTAYNKLRELLDREDWNFTNERELKSIELVGESFFEDEEVFAKKY